MSKKQSPIAEAIAWCDAELLKTKSGTYQPFLINVKAKLISLLSKEKEFAEEAYKEGFIDGIGTARDADWGEENDAEFSKWFKQYENE